MRCILELSEQSLPGRVPPSLTALGPHHEGWRKWLTLKAVRVSGHITSSGSTAIGRGWKRNCALSVCLCVCMCVCVLSGCASACVCACAHAVYHYHKDRQGSARLGTWVLRHPPLPVAFISTPLPVVFLGTRSCPGRSSRPHPPTCEVRALR